MYVNGLRLSNHFIKRRCDDDDDDDDSGPSVCLPVYPRHNSKTNDPKVFQLGIGNALGIP